MNVLVIGAGEVGYHLAKFLRTEEHRVTLVDTDRRALGRATQGVDVQTVEGHGGDYRVLQKAEAGKADLVVAVTNNDELNMLACLLANKLGAGRTVVRVHAGQHVLDHQYFYKDILGFDLTISPEEMAALEILRVCRGQNALPVENFAGGKLQMRRLEILEDSPACGKSFAELRIPAKVLATAVARSAEVTIPRGDFVLGPGDFVMLIGIPEALDKAEKVMGGRRDLPKRVLVAGGGPIALLVARDLESLGVGVRVIEPDEKRAEEISAIMEGADVVCGRPTDPDLLQQEGVHRTDVFVALGESDEGNILSCQLAKSLGANKSIALVNASAYAHLSTRLGIDHGVSPRRLVARRIAQYVRGAAEGSITPIYHGAAEVLDRVVPPRWPHAGYSLKEIPFPVGSVVGGMIREGEALVPHGDTKIEEGDHLIIFATRDVVSALEPLLAAPADPAS